MNLSTAFAKILEILNGVIPVMVALGVVYFVWGVVAYVIAGGEETKKKGRDRIIYGIIGLAIIVSLWGIVNIVIKTFNIGGASPTTTQAVGCNTTAGILNPPAGTPALQHFAGYINCTIHDAIIPFMFALALAAFVWGIVSYFIINVDEEAKRSQGKQFMIWGIVALTVMLCVWGLVKILGDTFGINTSALPHTRE